MMKLIKWAALCVAIAAVGVLSMVAVGASASTQTPTPVAPNSAPAPMAQPMFPRQTQPMFPRRTAVPGHYIVVLEDSVAHPGAVAETQTEEQDGELGYVYRSAIKGYSAALSKSDVEELREDPRVRFVTPDRRVEALSQTLPTGLSRISAPENAALDIDETDDIRVNADVAVIDTGVDQTHPDLNVTYRTNCVPANEEEWSVETCVDNSGTDAMGHGTHVAGIVGAIDNSFGVVGVAPGVRLWSVRVLGNTGSGYASWILAGIDWVTARASQIEVANMSLGGRGSNPAVDAAIQASVEQGVVYTVAAMNSDLNAHAYWPANSPEAITVSALADTDGKAGGEGGECSGLDDTLAGFSDWGNEVEIAAPGTCIHSTWKGGEYATLGGTSMASPHVAGAAAILASQSNPNTKADVLAIRQTLIQDAKLNWFDTSEDTRTEPLLYAGGKPVKGIEVATAGWTTSSSTTATLYGVANVRGETASYQFEYGPTTKYGSVAPPLLKAVPAGGAVSQSLVSLKPEQTYHYRMFVVGKNGIPIYGKDHTFRTSRWTAQSAGAPTHTSEWLRDVSCPSSTACMAVGQYYDENTPPWNLLGSYRRSGSSWTWHPVPAPSESEGNFAELEGVSCSAADGCSAVGSYQSAGGTVLPLAERWNGTNWTRESISAPPGATYTALKDVSCPSSTECVAVGYYQSGGVWRNFSARWKSGVWTQLTTANPPTFSHSLMESVSCASITSCIAVGWWVSGGSPALRLIAEWNGSSWSFQTPAQGEGTAMDVTCKSKSACVIVGNGSIERWDGAKWVAETYPSPSTTYALLDSVSCASPTSCTATGGYVWGGRARSQMVIWDGVVWRENPIVRKNAEARELLRGVSCVTDMGCSVVGEYNDGVGTALIETRPSLSPAATTEAASGISVSRATLKGTVDAKGLPTRYHFEWGTQAEFTEGKYNHSIPVPDGEIGSGETTVAVSRTIEGISGIYHYRLVAENSEGKTVGADQMFSTAPIAFQANDGFLWTYSPVGGANNTALGMKAATSPSATSLADGTYEVAFQDNNGYLWVYSPTAGAKGLGLGMLAGTSPSIAPRPTGGYIAAFHANNGVLWYYSTASGATSTGKTMSAGTSPAIAILPDGTVWIAYQAITNELRVYSPTTGQTIFTGLGMLAGTSPSIALTTAGSYIVAFQANNNELWTYTPPSNSKGTGVTMKAGTSPSIAVTPTSTIYHIAFAAPSNELSVYYSATGTKAATGLGMLAGTSPSITTLTIGGYHEVAFQASSTSLKIYTSKSTWLDTGLGMMAGTGPSIR